MPSIFISYRREDTSGSAGRLFDRLRAGFGRQRVFMDVDTLGAGVDFVDAIEGAVGGCDVLLVLIGPRWLEAAGAEGERRIDDERDFVRAEVASGLAAAEVETIPVLVKGARMPSSEELPPEIQTLARKNAVELSDTRWDYDVAQLVDAVSKMGRQAGPGERARLWLWRRRKALVVAAALVLAAVAGVVGIRLVAPPPPAGSPTLEELVANAAPRPSVAVLEPRNLSGDEEITWLSTAVADLLSTSLGAGEGLRVVGGGEVARAVRELGLESAEASTAEELTRLKDRLGVDYFVGGSFTQIGAGDAAILRVDLRLRDARSGEAVEEAGATGTPRQLFDLLERAGIGFRQRLGVGELTQTEKLAVMASLPSDPKAARPYAEALGAFRRYDAQTARQHLETAIEVEPDHPLPHATLARALRYLGFDAEAEAAAEAAMELAEFLSPTQRAVIEANYQEIVGDFERATEIYTELFRSHPDDLELGLRLARAQSEGGMDREALATIEALRAMPPPAAEDPRLELGEALPQLLLGQFEPARDAARRAVAKARARGDAHLIAEARLVEAEALQYLGEHTEAESALAEARELFGSVGDRKGVAVAQQTLAHSVWERGDLDGALDLFARSRAAYAELGDTAGERFVLQQMGSIRLDRGDLAAAEELHQQAMELAQSFGDPFAAAELLNEFGYSLQLKGDLEGAERKYSEAMVRVSELGREDLKAIALGNLGEVRFLLGDLETGESMIDEALAINRAIGARSSAAYNGLYLGLILAAKGDLFVAQQRLEEALATQEEIGETNEAASTRIRLAEIRLLAGEPEAAEKLAGEAEQVLRAGGEEDLAALAQTVLARALLAGEKLGEARRVASRYEERAAVSEDRELVLAAAIASARLGAAAEKTDVTETVASLRATAEEAAGAGYIAYAFEARLALADALAEAGAADAETEFAALQKEAGDLGFGLFAERAAAALDGSDAGG